MAVSSGLRACKHWHTKHGLCKQSCEDSPLVHFNPNSAHTQMQSQKDSIWELMPHSLFISAPIPICMSLSHFCPYSQHCKSSFQSAPSSASMGNLSLAPVPTTMTHDQILAKNAHQLTDNLLLQSCRDAGDLNVPIDELMILIPSQLARTALQQWISAFTQLLPILQTQGSAVLDSIILKATSRPNVASVVNVLFNTAKEAPSSSGVDSTYSFDIHGVIQDLLNAGQYCPLTLSCQHWWYFTPPPQLIPMPEPCITKLLDKQEAAVSTLGVWGLRLRWLQALISVHNVHN